MTAKSENGVLRPLSIVISYLHILLTAKILPYAKFFSLVLKKNSLRCLINSIFLLVSVLYVVFVKSSDILLN